MSVHAKPSMPDDRPRSPEMSTLAPVQRCFATDRANQQRAQGCAIGSGSSPIWRGLAGLCFVVACAAVPSLACSEGSLARDIRTSSSVSIPQGIASGDVSADAAIVWVRTDGPALVQVEWWPDRGLASKPVAGRSPKDTSARSAMLRTVEDKDFTLHVELTELEPQTDYQYRLWTAPVSAETAFAQKAVAHEIGRFRTAPPPDMHTPVSFVWSGDIGGQNRCRRGPRGYPILDRIRSLEPQFLLLLGDMIYADNRCESPPNEPGSDFIATSLDEYRLKHRYQRGAPALRDLLATVPIWAIWDDHEVRNDFSGLVDPQMPTGRQALLDYWPIRQSAGDPTRLYRSIRYGANLELFILDTRQYRSANREPDGLLKTMLGQPQLTWLLDGLTRSEATWKVVVSTVPIANNRKASRTGGGGNDSWARAKDGTGFESELAAILQTLKVQPVRNVVWLVGDVHYAQGVAFDPDGDGIPDFHEFIAGPLSAYFGQPAVPPLTFHPTLLFVESGMENFGLVTLSEQTFRVQILDGQGQVRQAHTIKAR